MKNILYLASQSPSRKYLLEQTGIPFKVFVQSADERECDWSISLPKLVETIAVHKMESLDFSTIVDRQKIWVLTADTLGQAADGHIYAKPRDYAEAVSQLKSQTDRWVDVATGFCLERKAFVAGRWQTEKRIFHAVLSQIYFSIADNEIDEYIRVVNALRCAGSIAIEGFGAQYLKDIKGSYSSVIGLPLYEVRQALKQLDFF